MDRELTLISELDEVNLRKYQQYKRSHLDRNSVKKLMNQTIQENYMEDENHKLPVANPSMSVIMAGLAKRFVMELTSNAREKMEQDGVDGAIQPEYLHDAFRQYQKTEKIGLYRKPQYRALR